MKGGRVKNGNESTIKSDFFKEMEIFFFNGKMDT